MKIKEVIDMRKAVERIIFDNTNESDMFDETKQFLIDEGNEDPSDNQVWDEVNFTLETYWDDEKRELEKVFDGKRNFLAVGTCGLWNGTFAGGFAFSSLDELMSKALKDCGYFKFWDENGHLFLQGWHHDGTNVVEIKELTDRGYNKLYKWEYDFSDHTSEKEIHRKLFTDSHYSKLIHYSHKVYGCPKVEYEKKVG